MIHRPYMWEDVYIYILTTSDCVLLMLRMWMRRIISRAVSGSPFCYHRFFRVWRTGAKRQLPTLVVVALPTPMLPSLAAARQFRAHHCHTPKEQPDTTNEAHRKPWPVGRVLSVGGIALCVPSGAVSRRHVFVSL